MIASGIVTKRPISNGRIIATVASCVIEEGAFSKSAVTVAYGIVRKRSATAGGIFVSGRIQTKRWIADSRIIGPDSIYLRLVSKGHISVGGTSCGTWFNVVNVENEGNVRSRTKTSIGTYFQLTKYDWYNHTQ